MKFLILLFISVFAFSSGCQSTEDMTAIDQMQEVIKKQPRKKHINYFAKFKHEEKVLYYIANPTPEKVEIVNMDKAEIQADYSIIIIRVKKPEESNCIIK